MINSKYTGIKAESDRVIRELGMLCAEEAAIYLGKSWQTFRQIISKQIDPAGKYGNRNYYRKEDLDKWISSHFEVNDSAKVKEVSENQN